MSIAPPAVAPACGAQNLTKVFGEGGSRPVVAVNNVTLAIEAGSFTAIMGPSGSGKSTLMHCMAGLDRATSGSAWVGDQDLSRLPERQVTKIRRDKIGFVFQSFNLLPTLTAEQNILLPLELAGRKPNREVFREIVDSLGLAERLTHRPSQLSGGQQQRVAIARALVTRPQVIFADEPTGALDSRTGTALLQYLQRCSREQGQTIIMVTHDPKAAGYADRALVLSDGSIVDDVARPSAEIMLASLGRLGA
ncbi:ABC transporter ATP-binding protein [Arachnia propionica]|uniref:Macrolide export ATP-binding/permease protein MacB n=1 Tax=Arachnia propionica TaxID=1750 RepID=A0A448MVY0_9ACTN|nr:ABC transporter, ATP-binding protein [Arachnia propionica F0230a]VEH69284.1 Macrolide export ATP-binding/permease protein MacB [Arachnia propionica]